MTADDEMFEGTCHHCEKLWKKIEEYGRIIEKNRNESHTAQQWWESAERRATRSAVLLHNAGSDVQELLDDCERRKAPRWIMHRLQKIREGLL